MDPFSMVKVLWKHRLLALPVVIVMLAAAVYVVFFGPRTYEASAVYVVVNPKVPTEDQLRTDSRLRRLNDNNPYLRSADPSLIVKVLISRMGSQATQEGLQNLGLSTEFSVAQSPLSTMTVVITASGSSPGEAIATREWLLKDLQTQLRELQKIDNADDLYLFEALPVDVGPLAVEKVSSRLRSLILVLALGAILVVGVVSIAVGFENRKLPNRAVGEQGGVSGAPPLDEPPVAPQHEQPAVMGESEVDAPNDHVEVIDPDSGQADRRNRRRSKQDKTLAPVEWDA